MYSKDKPHFSKGPISKEDLQKIKQVIETLEQDPQAYDFLEPVDYEALGLLDYPTIIKNPMDLGTVKKKLNSSKYGTLQEVLNDIQLIWDNCRTYNIEGSDIYKMANHCEKVFRRTFDKTFKIPTSTVKSAKKSDRTDTLNEQSDTEEVNSSDVLTVTEKMNVTDRVRKMSNEGLASLIKLIQKECPQAIEDVDSEKLQIRIDSIDKRTYEQINLLIDSLARIKDVLNESGSKVKK